MRRGLVVLLLLLAAAACSDDDGGDDAAADTTELVAPGVSPVTVAVETTVPPDVAEPELREELLAMMAEDQAEMVGDLATNNYTVRTRRLAEILTEYGWPGFDLVGEDGSRAAWVLAQHADLDPEVQQRALELLRAAAAAGQASVGDLAYLEDRVAVAAGQDQHYGTQMRCDDDGAPVPATPVAEEATLDQRRTEAGLPPYDEYVAEMVAICAGAG